MPRQRPLLGASRMLRDYFGADHPIRRAQKLLAGSVDEPQALAVAFKEICSSTLWAERRKPNGEFFSALAEFVACPRPHGLGVSTKPAREQLRHSLLTHGLFREWVQVMEGSKRLPGRPTKSTNGASLPEALVVSRSTNARDRILLKLKSNHPEIFEQVCNGVITPRQGAISAGIVRVVPRRPYLRFGAIDLDAIARLRPKAKARALRDVFDKAGPDAQCALLASRLEGVTGVGLAKQWRDHSKDNASSGPSENET